MTKVAIVCTGTGPRHLFPTFTIGSAAAAMGEEVLLFFTPAAAPALVKGELERVEARGMPDMGELVRGLQDPSIRKTSLAPSAERTRGPKLRRAAVSVVKLAEAEALSVPRRRTSHKESG